MRAIVLVMAITATGCSATWGGEHRTAVRVANVATASVAAAAMALDWCGTRHAAQTRTDEWEGGMPTTAIIGTRPSAGQVDAYFAVGTVAIVAAIQRFIPERYHWLAYSAVAAGEGITVQGNLSTTRCGPIGRR